MANEIITSGELLKRVKSRLGITGDFHNVALNLCIDDIKSFLLDAGVNEKILQTSAAVGVICRGVADQWDNGAGNGELSEYFKMRVTQLALKGVEKDG